MRLIRHSRAARREAGLRGKSAVNPGSRLFHFQDNAWQMKVVLPMTAPRFKNNRWELNEDQSLWAVRTRRRAPLNLLGGWDLRVEYQSSLVWVNETKASQVRLSCGREPSTESDGERNAGPFTTCRPQWLKILGEDPLLKKLPLVKELGATVICPPAQRNFLSSRASFGTFSGPQSIGLARRPGAGNGRPISTGIERVSFVSVKNTVSQPI
ncbi:hypothetical protein C8F04DRAFT_1198017, partial [Mycena alexandri]